MHDALRDAADELGFDILEDPDPPLRFGIERLLGKRRLVRITDILQRRTNGVRFVVATISHRGESDSSVRPVVETILFFSQSGLALPNMTVQPRGGMSGLQSAVLGLVGIPRIEFPDDAAFGDSYWVMAFQPECARALLDARLREYLAAHPGLTVKTENEQVAVYRSGEVVAADGLAVFVDEMNDVIMMVARRGRELEQLGISPSQEGTHTLRNMRGVGALVARRMLVSQDELKEFLQQQPPRTIPASIRRQHLGFGSIFFYVWGGMFLVIGTIVLTGLAVQQAAPPLAIAGFSLLPLMGLAAIVLAYRYRSRKRRLLRHGECCEARVTDVQATNVSINDQRRYKVTMICDNGGPDQPVTVNAYDPAVQKAFSLAESGDSTRLLVDPHDPRSVLWIDGLSAG